MKMFIPLAVLALLSGCASLPQDTPTTAGETLSYSVGPCFGFCPVYSVTVSPDGHVTYMGERHTAVLGPQEREAGTGTYRAVASVLAGYRPETGATEHTTCESQASDMQNYRIVWKAVDGTETVLMHDRGCRSARNDELNKAMESLPGKLGIDDWAKQTTRPGAGRG
ncbi:hypothetical protein ABI_24740 [Asticcacaulis biprosthecium C19]|uniref:DUF6438 domain-containing protein n=1 Tax=Asticcacaulis biprosthecium C19 TaxID=715226 RepID=F4QP03_9CAUL|nr:DUF6438 domain-containing protein [Asticcacaulis biprosthecium]EGF91061.1 hypothetical protein ABI_24740 [Asticcacaulis biprosthecium C19]